MASLNQTSIYDKVENMSFSLKSERFYRKRNLMLFDLSVGGHHPGYIQHLIEYWSEQKLSGILNIVVLPKFIQQHSDVVDAAKRCKQKNINFVEITSDESSVLKSRNSSFSRAFRAFQEWQLLCRYASLLKATHCLIMYFDTCELPLVWKAKIPCSFSGIYFKPTFHYSNFSNYIPRWKNHLQQWREKFFLSRVLHHPQMQTLFCLDPFAIKHINKLHIQEKVVHLPDPVQIYSISEFPVKRLRENLGIQPDRQVFLLFGSLTDSRKGISQLLEAVKLLPHTLCQKLCIVFAGEADPIERLPLESQIMAISQSQPVQIISNYEFIPTEDVHVYFHLADVVLAPYQKHIGMSGILLLAAAAQKPVLSSNYGLMGELVQRYSLGLAIDSSVPIEITKGLTQFLLKTPFELCDRAKMKFFAEENSAENFANTIFQHI